MLFVRRVVTSTTKFLFCLEKLNLYDYYLERYQKEHLTKWKDFVGRVKAGNKPAVLYPNLDLSKSSNKGDAEAV